jgi:DNA polymerase-3 subunit alpha
METAIEHAQKKKDEGKFGQVSLFGGTDEKIFPDFEFTEMPEMDRLELLAIEKELIGFYFSGHPLDIFKKEWEEYVTLDTSRLNDAVPGNYTLIGLLKTLKSQTDKTGKPMAFGTLEDYRGEIDLAFFGETWESCREKLQLNDIIAVKGRAADRRGRMSLQVTAVLNSAELKEGKIATLPASGHAGFQPKNREVLDKYREVWKQNMTLDLSAPAGEHHVLVGILSGIKTYISQKNQKEMAFGLLEDYRGQIDLVFFDQCWEQNKDKLIENSCIALKGKLGTFNSRPRFQVSSLLDLGRMRRSIEKANNTSKPEDVIAEETPDIIQENSEGNPIQPLQGAQIRRSVPELHIRLHTSAAKNEKNLYPLRDYLIDNPGTALVFIHVGEKIIRTGVRITAGGEQIATLGNNPIVAEVWVA